MEGSTEVPHSLLPAGSVDRCLSLYCPEHAVTVTNEGECHNDIT